ncbi:MAG: nucleotide disphospho-sugar-binding domain-containing protein [Acidimicrobiales bacterium]
MARIAVTSAVYLGDVAPYIPIARALSEQGHEVVFVAPEGFRSVLEPEPFAFHPYALDSSPAAMHVDPEHIRLMRAPTRNSAKLGTYWMNRTFADDPAAAVRSLQEGFAGADAVVTHPTMGVASIPVARSMGIPTVVGHLFPMMIPTAEWTPPLGSRSPRLPGPLNRASWAVLRRVAGRSFRDDVINDVRADLGLEPTRCAAGWSWLEADTTVVLVPHAYYGDGAADWPPVTWGGFSIWEGPAGQELDPALDAWIDAGDPPVLVMLGTSAATNAGQQFRQIAEHLDRIGLRSVLLVGDPANLAAVGERPGAVTFAPVTQLLPRCRAAVMSGALGGVAAALTAGVPLVVHPQLFDQVWHGRRVQDLGVGRLARRTSAVAPAVRRLLDDPGTADRCTALAERVRAEDGVTATVAAVDQVLVG